MPIRNSRRKFLGNMVAAGTLATTLPKRPIKHRNSKPNLLFLWTDEQRADTISVYGNNKIKTPNLAQLARESIVFENAYVTQPVCTPSRSSVMTGLWPHQNGCTQNNVALDETTPTFPELLDDDDYCTGYFGKWHLGDEIFPQHGFQEWQSIEDMYWRYYRENRDIDKKSDYCAWLKELGYEPDTSRGDFSREFAAALPIQHCKPKFLEQKACDFLRRHQKEPFILYVNFLEPHMPFTGPLNEYHRPDEVYLPSNFDDPLEENEPEAYRERAAKYTGMYSGKFDLSKESEWRRLIAQYWGLVSQVDISVGAILTELERLGLADNTIVVFTSDHGDMMGSHRLIEKSIMYQEALRVPWMIRLPKPYSQHRRVKEHVSHIDLVPTLLELMNKPQRDDLPGKSLVPFLSGRRKMVEPVFVQWNAVKKLAEGRNPGGRLRDEANQEKISSRAIITQDGWKLCIHTGDKNQLFHLAKDPGETKNLFTQPEHEPRIRSLKKKIVQWQEQVGDSLDLSIDET
ncbi:MAG TPA: sulfatase-like hydrolase/transferase [Candidatus Hydrogenedentes bacterium]|nr:sulfatase-like hydrolase/transferase [Candidatus Hydrogenedentota bacterium]HOL75512.1 sulfatase-like hydrolase/transferase [Candidatus Hydrogenedentota bacterium]HPO86046.1 sulfatase-like hydrolase/transferase [Candidatus Hydrogenedentota bacterium]